MVETIDPIKASVRTGALVRYRCPLEPGEFDNRMIWIRPEIAKLLESKTLDPEQLARVKAILKRFVVGGPFNVVTAGCEHQEVSKLGDIRELKGRLPPFIEVRVKPPKHDLRFFGRFVGKDQLILTSFGMKSLIAKTGAKPLSVKDERKRAEAFFKGQQIEDSATPANIKDSLSNATFL